MGPSQIMPCVLSSSVFVTFLSLYTCAYAPNWSLQILFQSRDLPVTIVRGMYVVNSPLLGGKSFRNITTCLAKSIFIGLVKLGKVRLALCAHIQSLITYICFSTSGTWSRASVVLSAVLTTFTSRNWNSGSTHIVHTCKPCDL